MISILISILTWIPRKKRTSSSSSAILRDFQNQDYNSEVPDVADRKQEEQELDDDSDVCVLNPQIG